MLNINAVVKYKFLKLHMILKLLSTTALQTNKYRKSSKNINLKEAISACGKIPEKWFKMLNFSHATELLFLMGKDPVTFWYFSAAGCCLWILVYVYRGAAGNTDLFWSLFVTLGRFQCKYFFKKTWVLQKIK